MSVTAVFVVALLVGAEARNTQVSPRDVAKAKDLVKQLAAPKFRVRDAAEKELVHLGLASLDALKEGERHPDPHVQDRCRQLQPLIRALSLQHRIDAFLANREGPLPENLPLVEPFLKLTTDSKESRQLYAELLQRNAEMMDVAQRDSKKGVEQFASYCQEIQQRVQYVPGVDYLALQKTITRADVALYLLMNLQVKNDSHPQIANFGYTFLNAPITAEILAKDNAQSLPFKNLFLNWLDKEPQPYLVQQGIQLAANAKMKEALPLVLKMVQNKTTPVYARAQTSLMLAKLGTKEHLKDIAPMLDDKSVVGNFNINNKMGTVQMRDIALAVSIKLSGQKLSDYDFDLLHPKDESMLSSYIYCAFSGDDKRDAAHKKYKEAMEKAKAKK